MDKTIQDSPTIISTRQLTKRFGEFTAVNDISFTVKEKEMFAFLGPNGAGKTTTIKMLITLLAPSDGEGNVCGFDVVKNSADVRRVIGYVPQLISVDGTLTAYENLMLMARLHDIPGKEQKTRVQEILEFLDLTLHARSLVRTFSGGMIRKLEIGQAMIHHPRVLFLDEPTTGLDPIAQQNVWDNLLKLRTQFGTTIFFSTHNMEEAADVADRVAIMTTGKIATIGTIRELTERTGNSNATLEDAFIFFSGKTIDQASSFRETRRARQTAQRLG